MAAGDWQRARQEAHQAVAHRQYRVTIDRYVEACCACGQVTPRAAALALMACGASERARRASPRVEPIWTGPVRDDMPFRSTEQALLEIIDSASERLLIVSYAVYRIPNVATALAKAAARGVQIRVVIESAKPDAGQDEYSNLKALGPEVAACSTVYYWPAANREGDPSGRTGIMHVKCAAADGRMLFLSSANLTEYAFRTNMELGVLIAGGSLPVSVERRFRELIENRVLTPVVRHGPVWGAEWRRAGRD